jgi:hypothetical protein
MSEADENGICLEEIIEDLRANEGLMFRRLLIRLQWEDHPDAKILSCTR